MRKLCGGMVVVALALALAMPAQAQRRTTATSMGGVEHELGVDLGAAYVKPSGISGGIVILTPVDVRFGFVPHSGSLMWEPRGTLNISTVGGTTTYMITPSINVLYANGPGGQRRGMYFTGGAGLVLADNGTNSGTMVQLGGGVGWRKPYGTGAWRYELAFQWTSENTSLGTPSTIAIGGRIGISLWH
jgi:hypothetical protein